MSEEEINYWLEEFEDNRRMYMSKDHKILSFYETFKDMKKLQQEKDDFIKAIIDLQYEIVDLKSVLKEIREIIKEGLDFDNPQYADECENKLLEIINKVIGEDK